jgi:peptidoglycan/LPS O-acetylase OafA/YrhL
VQAGPLRFFSSDLFASPRFIFLGLLIGLIATLMSIYHRDTAITVRQAYTAFALGIAWLPYLNVARWPFGAESIEGPIFPLNDPAWSLFFEFFVNAVFFLFLYRYRKSPGALLVLLAALAFILLEITTGKFNPGWGRWNFFLGFPRVIAEFFFGTLIYSLGLHRKKFPLVLVILVSIISLLCLFSSNHTVALFDSLTLIPVAVILIATVKIQNIAVRSLCKKLGDLSYCLYILHFAFYRLVFELFDMKSLSPLVQTFIVAAACLAVSASLSGVEMKTRRWFMSRLASASPAVVAP